MHAPIYRTATTQKTTCTPSALHTKKSPNEDPTLSSYILHDDPRRGKECPQSSQQRKHPQPHAADLGVLGFCGAMTVNVNVAFLDTENELPQKQNRQGHYLSAPEADDAFHNPFV